MSTEPVYPYVVVDIPAELSEEVTYGLFELGAQGVEERDATTLIKAKGDGTVRLVASFSSREEAEEAISSLDESYAPRIEEVIGDAWRDEWKKHFHPFELAPGIVVRPPWESYEGAPAAKVLELEPGRAFGTGLHETTSLVAQALYEHRARLHGVRCLDVGCGSGILSLVALVLGAESARAIDIDPDAVAVTQENAERNSFAGRVTSSTTPVEEITESYPVVVANIEAGVLRALQAPIAKTVAKGGLLILSGVLAPQLEDVRAAYSSFALKAAPAKGEWVALVLENSESARQAK